MNPTQANRLLGEASMSAAAADDNYAEHVDRGQDDHLLKGSENLNIENAEQVVMDTTSRMVARMEN